MDTGETRDVLGDRVTLLASGRDTGGTMTAVEVVAAPGSGTPVHTHVYAEVLYVLDGEIEVEVDGACRRVGRGELAGVPAGAPHTYRNVSAAPATLLAVLHPAGFERFLDALGTRPGDAVPTGPPDIEQLTAVARRHGVEIAAPPPIPA